MKCSKTYPLEGVMFSFPIKLTITFITLMNVSLLSACSEIVPKTTVATKPQVTKKESAQQAILDVFKSPTCSCCEKWLTHIDQFGFQSKTHNITDLSVFKTDKGIKPQYRSCHTAISKDSYVFEGHVPAKFIHQFLAKPPKNAIGLAVPAMPIGTPGMEVADKFMPYNVLLLKDDGSYEVYAKLSNYQEQF